MTGRTGTLLDTETEMARYTLDDHRRFLSADCSGEGGFEVWFEGDRRPPRGVTVSSMLRPAKPCPSIRPARRLYAPLWQTMIQLTKVGRQQTTWTRYAFFACASKSPRQMKRACGWLQTLRRKTTRLSPVVQTPRIPISYADSILPLRKSNGVPVKAFPTSSCQSADFKEG